MTHHPRTEDGECLNLGCLHKLEEQCSKRCETEHGILTQLYWLARSGWTHEKYGAKVIRPRR